MSLVAPRWPLRQLLCVCRVTAPVLSDRYCKVVKIDVHVLRKIKDNPEVLVKCHVRRQDHSTCALSERQTENVTSEDDYFKSIRALCSCHLRRRAHTVFVFSRTRCKEE